MLKQVQVKSSQRVKQRKQGFLSRQKDGEDFMGEAPKGFFRQKLESEEIGEMLRKQQINPFGYSQEHRAEQSGKSGLIPFCGGP